MSSEDESGEILVSFSDALVQLGADSAMQDFPLLLKPDLPGKIRWLGTRILSFEPDTPFTRATEFEVRLPKGIKSLSGKMLKQDYTFKFQTVRPELERAVPSREARLVGLKERIYLFFNQPMSPKRAKRWIHLVSGLGEAGFDLRNMTNRDTARALSTAYSDRGDEEESAADASAAYSRVLVLEPKGGLRKDEHYSVLLAGGLLARDGNLGLVKQDAVRFHTIHEFRFDGLVEAQGMPPDEALWLNFSNPVPVNELARNLRFEPAVELPPGLATRTWGDSLAQLYLPLRAETEYQLRISRNLKDKFGNRLGRDVVAQFRTGSFFPNVSMAGGNSVIEASAKPFYPVRMMNTDSVELAMGRIDEDAVIDLLSTGSSSYLPHLTGSPAYGSIFTIQRIWHPRTERNKQAILPIDLTEALGESRYGFVALRVQDFYPRPVHWHGPLHMARRTTRYFHAFTQVTDMGITGKFSPENSLILVTNLADAKPVPNARIELRDRTKRTVWTGETDEQGMAEAPGWAEMGIGHGAQGTGDGEEEDFWERPELWVFASKDNGDQAFIGSGWGTGVYPYDFNIRYDWFPSARESKGFVFTEKGLYHAGDSVHLKGIIRDKRSGAWVLPEAGTCSLFVTDPNEQKIFAQEMAISELGSIDLALGLARDAASGGYDVRLKYLKQSFYSSFRVEAYRPAEFLVKVTGTKPEYLAGDEFEGLIFAKYLFGAPLANARVTWSLTLAPYYFRAAQYADFDFQGESDASRYLAREEGAAAEREATLAKGAGKLDKDGKLKIGAKLDLKQNRQSMILAAEATATGPNLREISGAELFVVHRGEFYIGTKLKSYFLREKEPVEFQVITVGIDGKLKPGMDLQVEMYRRDWQSVRKAGFGGRYEWISKPQDKLVTKQKVTTGKEAKTVKLAPGAPGTYVVKCLGKDSKGNQVTQTFTCYASGLGRAGWAMRDDDRLDLVRDKVNYQPGDVARILVKSPYDSARALVTVEREFVIDKFLVELKGNAPSVDIRIKSGYLPNVFVSVMLLKGRSGQGVKGGTSLTNDEDIGKPGFKIGYVELPVSSDEKKLKLVARPDRNDYRPGDTAEVDVQVTGNDGAGAEAEVTLAVVDLGVLKLIGYDTPDPFGYFYEPRALSVATAESRLHVLGQRNYGEKGENRGGGGAEAGPAYRTKFLETAFYLPGLVTDDQGHARVRFKLPDNLTTFKIIAVAHSKDRFGSGDSNFTVSRPLVLQGSLPMFVRDGDEFEAGVVAYNNTRAKGTVVVKASVENCELVGSASSRVELAPQNSREIRFHYRVVPGVAGNPSFAFQAVMGKETDAIKLSIPRKNPALTEAFAVYEQTEGTDEQVLAKPRNARPGLGNVRFTMASSGLVGLEPGLRYLREYPYECLEQKLSRALPFIAAQDLIEKFRFTDLAGDTLRHYVANVLKQVGRFQLPNGGFRFWDDPSWDEPASPWLTAYCLDVLARAREHGYAIDEAAARQGVLYLKNRLGEPDSRWPYSYNPVCNRTTRAFMAWVLTEYKENVGGYLQPLYEERDKLSLFGRACLLKALHNQPGWAGPVAEMTREFMNQVKYAPGTAQFEERAGDDYSWIFGSNVRTTALIVQALLETQGQVPDAEKMVRWLLLERKSGRWRTTQENVYVFDALATYFRIYEHDVPDFTATVQAAMKSIVSHKFSGYSLAMTTDSLALDKFFTGNDTAVQVKVGKQGLGRLYYGIRLTYAPAGDLAPRTEGLLVRKEIADLNGRPVNGFIRGDIYRVTLKVYTPQDRLFVALDDPLPAGLEVMNTNFQTTSRSLTARLQRIRASEQGEWWGSFNHEEIYSDRYRLFATVLDEGVHTYVYMVKALTTGRFSLPPTKAEEMYTPEVFGISGTRMVTVR